MTKESRDDVLRPSGAEAIASVTDALDRAVDDAPAARHLDPSTAKLSPFCRGRGSTEQPRRTLRSDFSHATVEVVPAESDQLAARLGAHRTR